MSSFSLLILTLPQIQIPKAFGRVWHEGLLLKLEVYDATGKLFSLIKFKRVVLNGQVC